MDTNLDDDTAAQIQSFTSWAVSKGYHVIGALITNKEKPNVKVFATGPEDSSKQLKHVEQLVDILHYTVHKGKSSNMLTLPVGQM